MTVVEGRTMRLRYTSEELAVLADLFELESLPGVAVHELGPAARSQATRTLIARGIVVMPDDGGVEVTQPHAGLLAAAMAAETVVQVSRHEPDGSTSSTWFDDEGVVVEVGPDDAGIVSIALHEAALDEAIRRAHGIDLGAEDAAVERPTAVVELVRIEDAGSETVVERTAYGRGADGRWGVAG